MFPNLDVIHTKWCVSLWCCLLDCYTLFTSIPCTCVWWFWKQKHWGILRVVYVGRWRSTGHQFVANHSHVLWVHVQGLTHLKHNQYTGMLSIQATEHQSCGTRFGENCKTVMPSSSWCIMFHVEQRPYMCCHPFNMFCEYIGKVWQAWDIINTVWSCLSKHQST